MYHQAPVPKTYIKQIKIFYRETVVKSGAKIHVTTNDQSGGKKEDGKHLDKNRKKHQKTN